MRNHETFLNPTHKKKLNRKKSQPFQPPQKITNKTQHFSIIALKIRDHLLVSFLNPDEFVATQQNLALNILRLTFQQNAGGCCPRLP